MTDVTASIESCRVSNAYRPQSSLMVVSVWDDRSDNSRTEMWQNRRNMRHGQLLLQSAIKVHLMWRKNTNPKTRFTCGLNPGSRFAKMNGFLRDQGLLKPGLESVRPSRCGIKEGIECGAGVPVPSPLGSLLWGVSAPLPSTCTLYSVYIQ